MKKQPSNSKQTNKPKDKNKTKNNKKKPDGKEKKLKQKERYPSKQDKWHSVTAPIKKADSEIQVVSVACELDQGAFGNFPLGIIAQIMQKTSAAVPDIWGVYWALQYDFLQVINGSKDALNQRYAYMNQIYGSFRPKNIVTRNENYDFKWVLVPPSDFTPLVAVATRTYNFYFAIQAADDTNPSVPQQVNVIIPSLIDLDFALFSYGNLAGLLGSGEESLKFEASDITPSIYKTDCSAFAQSSIYWGGGSGNAGAPYSSIETEMPFKLGTTVGYFSALQPGNKRVGRFLRRGAGDACSAFTLPFIEGFKLNNYRTVNPVRFKFIDFAEIYLFMVEYAAECLTKFYTSSGPQSYVYVPIELGAFLGALRQCILRAFFDSQSAGQFMTPDKTGKWEGFRLGSNCVPKLDMSMLAPSFLVENLRLLQSHVYTNPKQKYYRDRNCIVYCPVIGIDPRDTVWTIPTYKNAEGLEVPLLVPGALDGINLIDGTFAGNVYNFNSKYYQTGIVAWNDLITTVSAVAGTTSHFSGSPPQGTLLSMTRYLNETNSQPAKLDNWPAFCPLPAGMKRQKVVRTKSSKGPEYEIVGGSSFLARQVVLSVSSSFQVDSDMLGVLPSFILPKITIATGGDEDRDLYNRYQTSYCEHFSYHEMTGDDFTINPNNRAANIISMAKLSAPGIAKEASDEATRGLIYMQKVGAGGFIADILDGAGQIAKVFGI